MPSICLSSSNHCVLKNLNRSPFSISSSLNHSSLSTPTVTPFKIQLMTEPLSSLPLEFYSNRWGGQKSMCDKSWNLSSKPHCHYCLDLKSKAKKNIRAPFPSLGTFIIHQHSVWKSYQKVSFLIDLPNKPNILIKISKLG